MWVTSAAVFNKLTPKQQELLSSTGDEVGLAYNDMQINSDKDYMQKMVAEGVTVTELTPESDRLFRQASLPFYSKGAEFGWSSGLHDTVQAAIK
jgi:TRAP-type C4-dicarboxylate transport system substrate-binding protein